MLLLAFLNEQAPCLKRSPERFCIWHIDSEDNANFDDLAKVLSSQVSYLGDVQKPGDRNIDVKGFMLIVFKNAVITAANRACDATNVGTENDKENVDPSCQVVCPISYVLMADDYVLAGDARAVIDAWFESSSWGSIPLRKNSQLTFADGTRDDDPTHILPE
jgi:hypothetical protein